jgi:hypothetical protein
VIVWRFDRFARSVRQLVNARRPLRRSRRNQHERRIQYSSESNTDYASRIDSLTRSEAAATRQAVENLPDEVFRGHPVQRGGGAVIDAILGDKTIRSFFKLA